MRNTFVKYLIKNDTKNTYFLTADVGFGVLEPLQKKMGDRFINVGIAEPSMISIAAGLALSKKIVYTYTMAAFYLKAVEQIKLDLCYMNLPVKMISFGKDYEYEQHGSTHFALEDIDIIQSLRNITVWDVGTKLTLRGILEKKATRPTYIRLSRFGFGGEDYLKVNSRKYPSEGGSLNYFKKKYGNKT